MAILNPIWQRGTDMRKKSLHRVPDLKKSPKLTINTQNQEKSVYEVLILIPPSNEAHDHFKTIFYFYSKLTIFYS